MKISFLTMAILFGYFTVSAQTNTFPSSGNAATGTTSPHTAFEVRGANGSYWVPSSGTFTSLPTALTISNANPGGYDPVLLFRQADGAGTLQDAGAVGLVGRGSWATNINASQVSDMYFNVRNASGGISERMRIANTGNVGIGTASPTYKLTVSNNDANGFEIDPANNSGTQTAILSYNRSTSAYTPMVIQASQFDFTTEALSGNTALKVAVNGNIGIGTVTPSEKLSVNGKIRAKEIKLETSGWPDFVFKPGYALLSLPATAAFIKTNGHLPGMPAAKEAETNGIGLGEMNKKLLQKVEELTLHLIEKDKQLNKQDTRINDLEVLLKAISYKINKKQ